VDAGQTWRIIYHVDAEAVVILEVFQKQTQKTPTEVLAVCRERLRRFARESR
jgi:phage-related protein